jgi:hypothetical protein
MNSYENSDSVGKIIIRNLFWGFYIAKPWFKRKPRIKVYNTGFDAHAFFNAFDDLLYCAKLSFAIVFLLVSIPIGIIRLIFALIFRKKRADITNANSIVND